MGAALPRFARYAEKRAAPFCPHNWPVRDYEGLGTERNGVELEIESRVDPDILQQAIAEWERAPVTLDYPNAEVYRAYRILRKAQRAYRKAKKARQTLEA